MELDFDIVVVANNHRKALILDYLKDIPHKVFYTPDYKLPLNWKPQPQFDHLVKGHYAHQGHLRCIRGHQGALNLAEKENILVFEDDAVPNRENWLDIVKKTFNFLPNFEIISTHGRNVDWNVFKENNKINNDLVLFKGDSKKYKYILGSLSYIIKKETAKKIQNYNYNGMPMDIFIANCFNFGFINPSPFDHNRSQGSLIDQGVKE